MSQIFLAPPVFFSRSWTYMNWYCYVLFWERNSMEFPYLMNIHGIQWTFMNHIDMSWDVMRCHEVASGGGAGSLGSARSIGGRAMCIALLEERYRKMKKPWRNQEKPRRKTEKNDTCRYRAVCFSWAPHLSIPHILFATLHGTDRNPVLWCVSPGAIVPNGSQWVPVGNCR
jgi:hypothetical protein